MHERPESDFPALRASTFCVVLLAAATLVPPAVAQISFSDMTLFAGVSLPDEVLGDDANNESLAWGDYDNDDDEDLYLTVNGENVLLRNDGDGTFTNVTTAAGIGSSRWGVGAAWGDLNNDGLLDLYVVNFSAGRDHLFRNEGPIGAGGEHVFTDLAGDDDVGLRLDRSSRGLVFLDYDADGLLDIYVNAIGADILYRNLGNFRFVDVAATACGAAATCIEANNGQGVGVVATDLDGNGWIDLYTGNRSNALNRLFLNEGGVFTDVTESAGVDAPVGLGMGVLSFDYDNDLDFDLYWTVWPDSDPQDNALFRNDGGTPLSFTERAAASGTTDSTGYGISCNAGDLDNDGWEDFFVTNGFNGGSTANTLFHNQGDGSFTEIAGAQLGPAASVDGRGIAFADYDNDGDVDFVLTDGNSMGFSATGSRLFRNDSVNANRWLIVALEGRASNRSAIGARITVTTDLGSVVKEVSGGAGRGSFNSLPVEFGLGTANNIERVTIRWPSGFEQELTGVALDQRIEVVETLVFSDGFESGNTTSWQVP